MIAAIEAATKRKAKLSPQPMQAGDVPLTWADLTKAKSGLAYAPVVEFEEGVKRFVEWYRGVPPDGA